MLSLIVFDHRGSRSLALAGQHLHPYGWDCEENSQRGRHHSPGPLSPEYPPRLARLRSSPAPRAEG